ncbi:uncharacterized protein LOC144659840 isoform X2 [Oculina patagonica]
MYSFRFLATLSLFLGFFILVVEIRQSSAMPIEGDNIDNDTAASGDDVIGVDGDNIDPKNVDEVDDDDDDVTITDKDVKEALAASSGELVASGQHISDVEASGSQSEAPVAQPQSQDNGATVNGEDEPQKIESDTQKLASEPQKEEIQAPTQDNPPQKDDSDALKDKEDALKEQSEPEQDETVEDINAQTPPPPDSDKQESDSTEQEDDDTPPPDETKQMNEAQSQYAADQQKEKALAYLSNARQRGVYSSPSQRTVICKDTTQKISCPPQQRIRILNADYGDTGDVGCLKEANPMPTGVCRTPGAYETVKRHCDGLEDCDLYASNGVFGDACPDANKYLDVNYECMNNPVPYPAAPVQGYNQASYQPAPQYVNPPPPPAAYAPAPYQAPPPQAYAPAMGLPNLLPPSPYAAPDPCSPCNTCAQCSLPVCSPCSQSCHMLTCAPRLPAKLQPLWQQWNERTADMSRMEMAALIISPLSKLAAPTKAPETTEASGAAEGSESESGDDTTDEDALYEASKRSGIQRVKSQQKSKKTNLTAHKKAHNKEESEQGFLRNSDVMVSSGDASSGSST